MNYFFMNFRWAKREDVGLILQFIKELAEYENLLNEVVATKELLEEQIFDKENAKVIFVMEGEKEVGFALFFFNFSTFLGKAGLYLEDLYIKPEYRGKGYGKSIFVFLANYAMENDIERIDWWCLDWNKKANDFYLNLGAKRMEEWTVQRLTKNAIKDLAKLEE
jgi:GNAT superfamily N-acetyltransferase